MGLCISRFLLWLLPLVPWIVVAAALARLGSGRRCVLRIAAAGAAVTQSALGEGDEVLDAMVAVSPSAAGLAATMRCAWDRGLPLVRPVKTLGVILRQAAADAARARSRLVGFAARLSVALAVAVVAVELSESVVAAGGQAVSATWGAAATTGNDGEWVTDLGWRLAAAFVVALAAWGPAAMARGPWCLDGRGLTPAFSAFVAALFLDEGDGALGEGELDRARNEEAVLGVSLADDRHLRLTSGVALWRAGPAGGSRALKDISVLCELAGAGGAAVLLLAAPLLRAFGS